MPAMDPFEFAATARREIDTLGAAKAGRGKAVHSIEGGVNRVKGTPPVPPSAPKKPTFKPGQRVKGFGNAAGAEHVNRIKGVGDKPILPK